MSEHPASAADEAMMRLALEAGRSVEGRTGDNPPVGCVVARGGRIVATGATQPPGGSHAEVMAIRAAEAAGMDIHEADVFVTLEPCTFTGRTPPCAALLIRKRPRRVVVAIRDPHPRVRGAGIAALREAGIEVVEGVLAADVRAFLHAWVARFDGA